VSLVDTHAHLDFRHFDADRQAVLERASAAGVSKILTVGTDVPSSRRAVALAAKHDAVYAAVGMHPHDAKKLSGEALAELRTLARHPRVVAVGEMGLDFFRDRSPRDMQRKAFQAQLAWSAKMGKPVIIHDRDAHSEVMSVLESWAGGFKGSPLEGRLGVLHTFSGDRAMAERAIELGFYISISGPVTYKNADQLVEVVRHVPLDRLLVETDCPFLTPHPYRGRRNEPAYVRLVAERIATLRGMVFEDLAKTTTANAERLFGFKAEDPMAPTPD
jgi:TatD DNase family protein